MIELVASARHVPNLLGTSRPWLEPGLREGCTVNICLLDIVPDEGGLLISADGSDIKETCTKPVGFWLAGGRDLDEASGVSTLIMRLVGPSI